jgi:hypothetical protein
VIFPGWRGMGWGIIFWVNGVQMVSVVRVQMVTPPPFVPIRSGAIKADLVRTIWQVQKRGRYQVPSTRVYKAPARALLPTPPLPHTPHHEKASWRSGRAVKNRPTLSDVRNPAAELCRTTCSIRGSISFFLLFLFLPGVCLPTTRRPLNPSPFLVQPEIGIHFISLT